VDAVSPSPAPAAWSPLRPLRALRGELAKRLRLRPSPAQLAADLAGRELLFRAPPLTADLVRAIAAITPQFHLECDERSRRIWELSQNGSSWAEWEAIGPLLESLGRPRRVLELGPGLGRSVVFLKKKLGWEEVPFDLFEGEGPRRKYALSARRSADSFCGDFASLQAVLAHNGIPQARIVDAAAAGGRLAGLPAPYDLVYSFYGVGYHWRLEDFWEEILHLLGPVGIGIFTLHRSFVDFPALREVPHGRLAIPRILARDRSLELLIVGPQAARLRPFVPGIS
jgi:SAM-dependent methyltransferase